MNIILETQNFIVKVPEQPHVTRNDGGHIVIFSKKKIKDRTELQPKEAAELMRLTIIVGKAMQKGLKKENVNIERINYQENGNWQNSNNKQHSMHIHLYGRTKTAKIQKFGQALYLPLPFTGFYNNNKPLKKEDIRAIKKEVQKILKEESR